METRRRIDTALKKAWTLLEGGRIDLAMEQFDLACSLDPADETLDLEQGVALFQSGRLEDALRKFEGAREKNAANPSGWANAAKVLRLLGRAEEGLQRAEEGLVRDAGQQNLLLAAGLCELDLDRPEAALARFTRAGELKPGEPEPWLRRSQALRKLGRTEEALAAAQEACDARPGYPEGLHEKALCLREYDRFEDAWQCLARAVKTRGNAASRELCLDAAGVAFELGMHSEASTLADKLIGDEQDDVEAWLLKGRIKEAAGDGAGGALCLGTGHMIAGRLEEALTAFDQAVELRPAYPAAWCNRASVLKRLERYEDALASYDRALADDPGAAVVWHNKGALLYGPLDRQEEALACFREEIKLVPKRWFELEQAIREHIPPP